MQQLIIISIFSYAGNTILLLQTYASARNRLFHLYCHETYQNEL